MEQADPKESPKEKLPEGILPGNVDGFKKKEYLYRFGVDTWYPAVGPSETFETRILDLSAEEGKALLKAYSVHYGTSASPLNEEEIGALSRVEKRLDAAIKEFGPDGAFVKLSHRSPKDAVVDKHNARTQQALTSLIDSVPEGDKGALAIAWLAALGQAMRVHSGKEAVELLTRSYRIRQDLNEDVEYPAFFKSKLIVRRFQAVDPALEFRGFVSSGVMTCLSQYESGIFFPQLPPRKKELKHRILAFWDSIKDKITENSYVIDFALREDRPIIVELNPFHANTSGCMFSWKEDREQILRGPFCFRLVERPLADPLGAVPTYWIDFMDAHYSKRRWLGTLISSVLLVFCLILVSAPWYF